MTIVNILLIIVGITNLIWGIVILLLSKDKKINKSFSIVIFSVSSWIITFILMNYNQGEQMAFWYKMSYVAAILIPTSFLIFTYIYPTGTIRLKKSSILFILIPVILLIFLTVFSKYILISTFRSESYWNVTDFGNLFPVYIFFLVGYFTWSFINLYQTFKKETGLVKIRTLYIFWGSLISAFIGVTFELIMPYLHIFQFEGVGPIATIFWFGIITYSIYKYRFFDVRIALKRILIYLSTAGLIYLAFYTFSEIQKYFWNNMSNWGTIIIGIIFAIIFTIILVFMQSIIQKSVQEHIYEDLYFSHEIIRGVGNELSKIVDIEKIIKLISNTLKRNLNLEEIAIVLKSDCLKQNNNIDSSQYIIANNQGYDKEKIIEIINQDLAEFSKDKNIIVKDELNNSNVNGSASQIYKYSLGEEMLKQKISIILPLREVDNIIGFVILGEKKYQGTFTSEELEILESLSEKYAVAIKNAIIYGQCKLAAEMFEK